MKDYDIYRDSYLRYLGYTNEIGEAFRPLVPRSIVTASYGIATAYVCADTWDKSRKAHKEGQSELKVATTAIDVFIWQMLASVCIPGFTINRITWITSRILNNIKVKQKVAKWAPTIAGLCSIPLIIHPIDNFVDYVMDNTYRKFV